MIVKDIDTGADALAQLMLLSSSLIDSSMLSVSGGTVTVSSSRNHGLNVSCTCAWPVDVSCVHVWRVAYRSKHVC